MPRCDTERKRVRWIGDGALRQSDCWAKASAGARRTVPQMGLLLLALGGLWLTAVVPTFAAKLTLRDGRVLTGGIGEVAGLAEDASAPAKMFGGIAAKPIQVIDNGLTRTFEPKWRVAAVVEAADPPQEKIRIRQHVARKGLLIGGVGPIMRITPFDKHGRRILTMKTQKGRTDVIQGITEITPVYCRVEGLLGGRKPYVWESRIATSSIPRVTLSEILTNAMDPKKPDQRLKIVRLYLQSERYEDARAELEKVVADFPDLAGLKAEVRSLRQVGARRLLREIQHREAAGQHQLAQSLLSRFPAADVAGETLEQVREILAKYKAQRKTGQEIVAQLDRRVADLTDEAFRRRATVVCREIAAELNFNTLERMASLQRLADDQTLNNQQKLSLAISGWLIGSNHATENLPVALSLLDVRQAIVKYLRESNAEQLAKILTELQTMEGASPQQVAQLIAHMTPPLETPEQEGGPKGYYVLSTPGPVGGADVTYYVQLPPEYDPHRRYPVVVTLNGAGSTPAMQVDWWAGGAGDKGRMGQATRHGYITLAVAWLQPYQHAYGYSSRAHQAVLSSLRDACRRFAVDTDRVFLSGHDIGGDAAWDIALAHPDLWAGVIPIVAVADKYCSHFWENARYVPFYAVGGELDGNKVKRNARNLDRYLRYHFDTTVVEYQGRGHEHFHDEVQRIFDWMGRRERNFSPKEFECATMRQWDNFFWWLELTDFPMRSAIDPVDWPPPRGRRAMKVSGSVKRNNNIFARTGGGAWVIWLTPDLIDFQKRVIVTVNGQRVRNRQGPIRPDLATMLEDVRSRGDRQHPFWARVEGG